MDWAKLARLRCFELQSLVCKWEAWVLTQARVTGQRSNLSAFGSGALQAVSAELLVRTGEKAIRIKQRQEQRTDGSRSTGQPDHCTNGQQSLQATPLLCPNTERSEC